MKKVMLPILLVVAISAVGCGAQLKDDLGKDVSLRDYDRITVGTVNAGGDVPAEMVPVLAQSLKSSFDADDIWNQPVLSGKPRSIVLNVFLTDLNLPSRIDQIISGAKPKVTCYVTITDAATGQQIASTSEFSSPRRSLVSMAMSTGFSGMAMNFLKMKQYMPSYCVELAPKVSDEIVEMVDKAKKK